MTCDVSCISPHCRHRRRHRHHLIRLHLRPREGENQKKSSAWFSGCASFACFAADELRKPQHNIFQFQFSICQNGLYCFTHFFICVPLCAVMCRYVPLRRHTAGNLQTNPSFLLISREIRRKADEKNSRNPRLW